VTNITFIFKASPITKPKF